MIPVLAVPEISKTLLLLGSDILLLELDTVQHTLLALLRSTGGTSSRL